MQLELKLSTASIFNVYVVRTNLSLFPWCHSDDNDSHSSYSTAPELQHLHLSRYSAGNMNQIHRKGLYNTVSENFQHGIET